MNGNFEITILVNNVSSNPDLITEHGYSLHISDGERKILFDAGQERQVLENNASKLGIDLKGVDTVVLSHGHYDHSGGLEALLSVGGSVDFYAHPAVLSTRFSVRPERVKSNGMPPSVCEAVHKLPQSRRHWSEEPVMLTKQIGLTGYVPRVSEFEDTGGPFFLDQAGTVEDLISDDQALWLQTKQGLVICAGCSHSGIVNIVRHVLEISGGGRIYAVIGGLHLVNASHERIDRTIEALEQLNPELIVPCHCTGAVATDRILEHFNSRAIIGASGQRYLFEQA
jgi:7,8-dihydropterin-6-yl-methyl-4-(beta-D-ribofuranosyl)aminobenzene 5'-phosphate synthase